MIGVLKFKEMVKEAKELYHSNNRKYGGKSLLVIAGLFALFAMLFMLFLYLDYKGVSLLDKQSKIVYQYLFIIIVLYTIFFLISYFYIYGKFKPLKGAFKFVYCCYLIVLVICTIPILVFFTVLRWLALYRAKKIDNILYVWLLFMLDSFVFCIILWFENNFSITVYIYNKITNHISLNRTEFRLFLFLLISEVTIRIVHIIIFKIILYMSKKSFDRKRKIIENNSYKAFSYKDDIGDVIRKKEETINIENKKYRDEMDYDISYYSKTLLKMRFLILVSIAFAAIYFDFWIFKSKSTEIINVVTSFSLIIFYFDKRAELGKIVTDVS